jgi:hypothetical protein
VYNAAARCSTSESFDFSGSWFSHPALLIPYAQLGRSAFAYSVSAEIDCIRFEQAQEHPNW